MLLDEGQDAGFKLMSHLIGVSVENLRIDQTAGLLFINLLLTSNLKRANSLQYELVKSYN